MLFSDLTDCLINMHTNKNIRIIEPGSDSFTFYISQLWASRKLAITLFYRDVKVKFAQTLMGIAWVLIQPAMYVLLFSLMFGYALGWKAGHIPYPLYALSGLLIWNLFSYIVANGASGMKENASIIRNIPFPRTLILISKCFTGALDFAIGFGIYLVLMVVYGAYPEWKVLLFPFVCVGICITSLGFVFWISAFIIKYRDLMHAIPFLLFVGIWTTPVFITPHVLPAQVSSVFFFNPISGWIELARFCLFDSWHFNLLYLPSMALSWLFALLGLYVFVRNESYLADYI